MAWRLEAFLEGAHVGWFDRAADGDVRFHYDADAPDVPISLSLPRDRPASRMAAANFLSNLLPDHQRARARLAATYGASGTSAVELLRVAGGDLAGGLVITPEGESIEHHSPRLSAALPRDVAGRIASIKQDPDSWAPAGLPARFSLAGTQGKFALAHIAGQWYWPNATVPSTHIFKPGRADLPEIERVEAATLDAARNAGVAAARACVTEVAGESAFVAERFDRDTTSPALLASRLHTEDLAQALGVSSEHKYRVTAKQIVRAVRSATDTPDLVDSFLRQLVFNTLIGNADAHAKNYSLLIRPAGISWAPLYDSVPTGLYPAFDQRLAMPIAGARFSQAITMSHWRKFARSAGLDEDAVSKTVRSVARSLLDTRGTGWQTLAPGTAGRVQETVARNSERVLSEGDQRS